MSKKLFLVIGKPGSGKSTAAEAAARQVANARHFSIGEELRAIGLHGKPSAISLKLTRYSAELKLHQPVPAFLATEVFKECVSGTCDDIVIIDGYPQYEELFPSFEAAVAGLSLDFLGVCYIEISDHLAKERLAARARRSPDVIEDERYIINRLSSYKANTLPALKILADRYPVFIIDGSQSRHEVASALAEIVATKPDPLS